MSSKKKAQISEYRGLARTWQRTDDERLGRGGQAEVFKVRSGNVTGAVKALRSSSDYAVARMENEITALRDLASRGTTGVVRIIDADPSGRWYVMPEGRPLDEVWLNHSTPQAQFDRALEVIDALLAALEQTHKHGYLHRDIKPENVLCIDNKYLLADFGVVHSNDLEGLTKADAPGNLLVAIPEAAYGGNKPIVDCIYVVHLWAWLLAEDPARGSGAYHWAFHEFVRDARCEFVRGLLAEATRIDSIILSSAASFTHHLTSFRNYLESRPVKDNDDHAALAAKIQAEQLLALSREQQAKAATQAALTAQLGLAIPLLAELIAEIKTHIVGLSKHMPDLTCSMLVALDLDDLSRRATMLALGHGASEMSPISLLVISFQHVQVFMNLIVKKQPSGIQLVLKRGRALAVDQLAVCTDLDKFEAFASDVRAKLRSPTTYLE